MEKLDLTIADKTQRKINRLMSMFPDREWSGVLFYTKDGETLTAEDFVVLNVGFSTYTSFEITKEVASYIAENMELASMAMGLIHSHNKMAAFFSVTDMNTMRIEGEERNNFLSLVVSSTTDYVARITFKAREYTQKSGLMDYEILEDGYSENIYEENRREFVDVRNVEVIMNPIKDEEDVPHTWTESTCCKSMFGAQMDMFGQYLTGDKSPMFNDDYVPEFGKKRILYMLASLSLVPDMKRKIQDVVEETSARVKSREYPWLMEQIFYAISECDPNDHLPDAIESLAKYPCRLRDEIVKYYEENY